MESHRLPVLAVLGAGSATPDEERAAEAVGALAARHGWVLLTGGGPGVMAAASRGAVEAGGLTVGVLPTEAAISGYPNPWVNVPIFTGAGMARNAFNVLSATLCVAIGGGAGTLSEIGLALKAGVPVWCLQSWTVVPPAGRSVQPARVYDDRSELLADLETVLACDRANRKPTTEDAGRR